MARLPRAVQLLQQAVTRFKQLLAASEPAEPDNSIFDGPEIPWGIGIGHIDDPEFDWFDAILNAGSDSDEDTAGSLHARKNAPLAFNCAIGRFTVSDTPYLVIGDSRTAEVEQRIPSNALRIHALALSPDGTWLASAGDSGSVPLWGISDNDFHQVRTGHYAAVHCIAISPDWQTIASGSADRTIRLWDSSDGRCIRVLEGFADWGVLAISPDGQYVVGGNPNGVILVRRLSDGAPTATLTGHKAGIQVMRFSPDGRLLATGGNDGSIHIWNTADWSLRGVSTSHTDWVRDLCFRPDGALLASASDDRSASVVRTADLGLHLMLRGHEDTVRSVAFSDDNQRLVSASDDGRLRIWNVADDQLKQELADQSGKIINIAVVDGVIASRSIESVSIRTFADPQNARSITMQCER